VIKQDLEIVLKKEYHVQKESKQYAKPKREKNVTRGHVANIYTALNLNHGKKLEHLAKKKPNVFTEEEFVNGKEQEKIVTKDHAVLQI